MSLCTDGHTLVWVRLIIQCDGGVYGSARVLGPILRSHMQFSKGAQLTRSARCHVLQQSKRILVQRPLSLICNLCPFKVATRMKRTLHAFCTRTPLSLKCPCFLMQLVLRSCDLLVISLPSFTATCAGQTTRVRFS